VLAPPVRAARRSVSVGGLEHETGGAILSDEPMPLPAEIAVDPQFTVGLGDESTFELVWSRARTNL